MLKVMFTYPVEDSFEALDEIESIAVDLVDIDSTAGSNPDSLKKHEEWFKNNEDKDWFVIYEWWRSEWLVTDIVILLNRGLGIKEGIQILLDRFKLKMRQFKQVKTLYLIYGYRSE